MRSPIARFLTATALALAGSMPSLLAADQLLSLTPDSLAAWSVFGTEKTTLADARSLVLPPSAQLQRDFPNGAAIARLISQPVFSAQPSEWPVLEIGGAVLAMVRYQGKPQLVVVTNEDDVIRLPWTIPDETSGSLEVVLAYDPVSGTGLVGFLDKIKKFPAGLSAKPVEIALSAGDRSSWPVSSMDLLLLDGADSQTKEHRNRSDQSDSPAQSGQRLQAAADELLGRAPGAASDGASPTPTVKDTPTVTRATLEIFTPPAVRRMPAENLRALIAKKLAR